MGHRSLSPDEAALWVRVMAGVRPIARRPAEPAPALAQGSAKPKAPPPPTAMPKASRTALPDRSTIAIDGVSRYNRRNA